MDQMCSKCYLNTFPQGKIEHVKVTALEQSGAVTFYMHLIPGRGAFPVRCISGENDRKLMPVTAGNEFNHIDA